VVTIEGPAHIQIASSTFDTNLLSITDLMPQCTNNVNVVTCTKLKDLTANQVINFWFKFAFQESTAITAKVQFKNTGGIVLSEYTMLQQTPVT